MRELVAFLVAPLAIPIAWGALGALRLMLGDANYMIGQALSAGPYMALIAWIFGVPTHFLLYRRHGWLQWWQYMVGGVVFGAVALLLFRAVFQLDANRLFYGGAAFLALGGFSALLFWVIGVRRPNQSLQPTSPLTRRRV